MGNPITEKQKKIGDITMKSMAEPTYAYLRGVLDAYNIGSYQFDARKDEMTSPNAKADYKAGYDKGMTIYCDDNNLND
jgi:hypothetical protein